MDAPLATNTVSTPDKVPSVSDLRQLATTVYGREHSAISKTRFSSTTDRLKALHFAKDARDQAHQLLEVEDNALPPTTPEQKRASEEVWKRVRAYLWGAINAIRNMQLRSEYIGKIKSQALSATAEIGVHGPLDDAKLKRLKALTDQAIKDRNGVMVTTRSKLTKSSPKFSEWLKSEGMTFDKLADKYAQHIYGKIFKELVGTAKKVIRVYAGIIKAAGRSNEIVDALSMVEDGLSMALIIILAGTVVWDVTSACDPVTQAIRDVWVKMEGAAGGFTGYTLASTAISSLLVGRGVAQATAAAVALIGGIVAGFVLATVVSVVADGLFSLMVDAFSLHIPPQLMTSLITVVTVPIDSALTVELTTSVTTSVTTDNL